MNFINIINMSFFVIAFVIIFAIFVDEAINKIKKKEQIDIKKGKLRAYMDKIFSNKKSTWIIFSILLFVAVFTRIYRLDTLLHTYNCDELGTGYDAFCIANYGTDRYLNRFPIYFINFGGGQSALPIYLTALIGKIFGFGMATFRIPNTMLSLIAIIASFFAIREIKGDKIALTFMALMVSCPWHLLQSRIGLDCNMQANMTLIAISALICCKKNWHYIIAGILFGLTLYSYILSVIVTCIFLFILFIYMLYVKRINWKQAIIFTISFIITAIPMIYFVLVSKGICPELKGIITIPNLVYQRVNEFELKSPYIIKSNIIKIFTNDEHIFNSIPLFGNFYKFAIQFAVIGLVIAVVKTIKSIKNRKFDLSSLFLFLFISNTPLILTLYGNTGRLQTAVLATIYFILLTLQFIYKKSSNGFACIIIIYTIMSVIFFGYYFNQFEKDYQRISFADKYFIDVLDRIEKINSNKEVICRNNTLQSWIYIAYGQKVDPLYIINNRHEKKIDPRIDNFGFGKYYYYFDKEIEPDEDKIYVIRERYMLADDYYHNIEKLRNNKFIEEKIGDYYIFYK